MRPAVAVAALAVIAVWSFFDVVWDWAERRWDAAVCPCDWCAGTAWWRP
jgi:hypothetical protein